MNNGKSMLEIAQETKRKWNLDDKTGNKSKITKSSLLSVAAHIDLVIEDGNPNLVDKMLELDYSRTTDSEQKCSFDGCNFSQPSDNISNFDNPETSRIASPSNVPYAQDGNSEAQVFDLEPGWSTVGPRKKNKKVRK